jgi:hypothetical protein
VITTLSAATWSPTDVLFLYRARWQVELVFKKQWSAKKLEFGILTYESVS